MSRPDRPVRGRMVAVNDLTPAMPSTDTPAALTKLGQLRAELAELAFALERRGRLDAADVANSVAARLAEVCDELASAESGAVARFTPSATAARESAEGVRRA